MTEAKALELERQHNVCIDPDTEQYNTDSHDACYGWLPIPKEWIDN